MLTFVPLENLALVKQGTAISAAAVAMCGGLLPKALTLANSASMSLASPYGSCP